MNSAHTHAMAGPLGFLLVALPLLLAVGFRGCWIDVQCGDVLDLDGGQYRLNGDLVCPFGVPPYASAAVTITGDRVHFNLRGYEITRNDGSGRFLAQGIAVRGANAHINHGSIVDINCPPLNNPDCAAIRLIDAPGAWINGMSLHNNNVGIILFLGHNADGARIRGNDITGNLRIGIGLFGSAEGALITGNDLSDTGGFEDLGTGYIGSSDGVSLIGNVSNNNAMSGIVLWGNQNFPPAQRNTIRDNTTLDNGFGGIGLIGDQEAFIAFDNLVQSNTSFGNLIRDLTEGVALVPPAPDADCLNTWEDNDFDVAAPDCIE